MEDDGTVKLRGKAQLKLKSFPHTLGNCSVFEPIKSDFTDPKPKIFLQPLPKSSKHLIPDPRSLIPRIPRMHADEVAPDQELAHRRIAARHMAMRVGHSSLFPLPSSLIALKRSFNAILIDSVAMPAVIFE